MPALFTLRRAGGPATAVAAIALTLSACSSSSPSASSASTQASVAAASGGTYDVGLITPTGGIDPLTTTQYDTMFAVGLASAQLLNETPAGQLKPQLASSWTQAANKLSWTFTLRPGLKFSNGQPLTATDVPDPVTDLRIPAKLDAAGDCWSGSGWRRRSTPRPRR